MPVRLALIPLLLFASPWRQAQVHSAQHHVGPWTVRVSADRFSGRVRCRLFGQGMDYRRGTVIFRLPGRIDTSTAVYRVDDGEPVDVRTEVMDMARLGFAIYRDDLANPSGGVVRVPQARLIDANAVRIQAGPKGASLRFKVAGLGAALEVARASGCQPAAFDPDPA
jgi:hypothetical protein